MIPLYLAFCLCGDLLYFSRTCAPYSDCAVLWTWQRMMARTDVYGGEAGIWFSRN
jgi:hypothetical protein